MYQFFSKVLGMENFIEAFVLNFIKDNRYMLIAKGLFVTIEVTFFAAILGIILGFIVALARLSKFKIGKIKVFSSIASVYVDIIRGTPMVIQLLIIYYIIFGSVDVSKVVVAVIAFSMNSAAYVSEIVRAGILAVDKGQMEAGRSLGLSYVNTMWYIIMPQAIKNILPALANEFIVLLKETAIVGYIALEDLTKAGDFIRSRTFDPYMPLLAVAIIYLAITTILSKLFMKLEGRMRQGDNC